MILHLTSQVTLEWLYLLPPSSFSEIINKIHKHIAYFLITVLVD